VTSVVPSPYRSRNARTTLVRWDWGLNEKIIAKNAAHKHLIREFALRNSS